MTDGPFRNLKLDSRSKRFAEAVQNDAVDQKTRCAYANDAILNGILRENQALLRALQDYGQDGQLDLDPIASVKGVFDSHPKSEFADHLQREVGLQLHEGEKFQAAINSGLEAALESSIGEFRTRTHEACLEAYGSREMRKDQLDRFVVGCNLALRGIDCPRILKALKDVNKGAFKKDVMKKEGLDEGPRM
ncbi:hypothetical protein [Sedimenticola selenatireducens]|nr:hypothetical protein [Sedimenticola selenatireducens]